MGNWRLASKRCIIATAFMLGVSTLAACGQSTGGSAGGEGIEPGATKAEYQDAFEDVSEITLHTQTPAPKGSETGLPMEEYYEAVEDWSGGKIKFDISYSNAIAEPEEVDDALADGRLDFASPLPIYEPSEYPANAALIEAGFISDQSAVQGALSSNAWPNQVAFETDEVMQEYEDHDMVPLVPVYNSGANMLFCTEPRTSKNDISGTTVASGGSAQSSEIEAVGASPTSVAYTELYESLERGVVDCTISSPTVAVLGGFISAAPYVTVDPDAGFALAPGALAFSKQTWDSLPLVAKQLLWDRVDVFISANVGEKIFANNDAMAKEVKKAGGKIQKFDKDARSVIQDENERLLSKIADSGEFSDGDAVVKSMKDANAEWIEKVDSLNFDKVSYADFSDWWSKNESQIDPSEYTDLVEKEIFSHHRPS